MRCASGTRLAHTEPGLPRPIDDSDGTGRLTPSRCCEFVDSRLRRSPPDRASAVPYGQAGENAMRFPHLAHRSAAAHKLHSTSATRRDEFVSGNGQTSTRLPALSLVFPGGCPNNRDHRIHCVTPTTSPTGSTCVAIPSSTRECIRPPLTRPTTGAGNRQRRAGKGDLLHHGHRLLVVARRLPS